MGRQWFALHLPRSARALARRNQAASRRSTPFSMRNSSGLASGDCELALVGFSQGTMMALHVGLGGPSRPRRSSAFRACWWSRGQGAAEQPKAGSRRRRSCSIHGDQDDDSVRRAVHLGGSPRRARSRSSGICRSASAMASTPKACARAGFSWARLGCRIRSRRTASGEWRMGMKAACARRWRYAARSARALPTRYSLFAIRHVSVPPPLAPLARRRGARWYRCRAR